MKHNIAAILENHSRVMLYIILCCILVAGLAYSIILGNDLRYHDEHAYFSIASNIATKAFYSENGYEPSAFRPPGYPMVLSLFIFTGVDIVFLRFLNFIFLSGSIIIIYTLLKGISIKAAIIGSALPLLYPIVFYAAGTLYPQTFGSFLFLLFIYLVFGIHPISKKRALFAGIVMGYLILVIPTFIFAIGITLLYFLFHPRRYTTAMILVLGMVLIVGAWTIRNYNIYNSFILVSTNSGRVLLEGNSENTTSNSGSNVDISKYTTQAKGMGEIAANTYYRSKAIEYIKNNPGAGIRLYASKVINYFNFRNDLATRSESASWKDLLMLISYGSLLGMVIIRIVNYKRYPLFEIEKYIFLIYFSNAFFQAIFFTRIRYRLPFDLLLICVDAVYLSFILQNYINHNYYSSKVQNI
jgi:hypothetical protein